MMETVPVGKDVTLRSLENFELELPFEPLPTRHSSNQRFLYGSSVTMITQIFVYGTLKRGQCRDNRWPCDPIAVIPAMTRGTLYDREDYPAMTPGLDLVVGECWSFREQDIPSVLRTLDEIEGANQPGTPDLYHRVEVDCWQSSEAVVTDRLKEVGRAFAYHYARDPAADGFRQVSPTRAGQTVRWPPLDRPVSL